MSDSDDTDLLLLIPPDFFAVQSDIDESEQSVVDDIIIHVNDLENRISAIENSGKSQLSLLDESLDLNQTKIKPANEYYLSMTDSLHSRNIDTLHLSEINDFIKGKSYKSPPKSRYPFTIPSTPISEVYNRTELLSPKSNYNESSDRYDASDNQMNVSNPSNISVANKENDKIRQNGSGNCEEKGLVREIDQYLNEINKCGPTGLFQKKEGLESISLNSSIMNDYKIDGFERHCNPELTTALDLPEVDRLLKEMEETQYEIEQKLKLHNSPKVFDKQVYYSHHLENNDYLSNSSRKYVPLLKSGEIKIDGVSTLRDTSSFQSRYSPKSRKKLDMSFGHKNVEKYNTSNYRSYDDTSRKLDTLKSSLYSSSSPLKSTQTYGTKKLDSYKYLTPTKFNISKHLEAESLKDKPFVERQNQSDTEQLNEVSNQYTTEPNSKSKENSHDIGRERTESTFDRKRTTAQTTVDSIINHDQQHISSKGPLSSELRSGPTNLLSLTDLWNKEPLHNTDDPKKLRQKLEEEKYRREHCEEIIKNLQYRVLEDQEKLAVAVHVDQEKDKAIVQLTEAWRKLVQHWGELENQRHNLSLQLQTEKNMSRSKLEEMAKKVTQCETEVAQALDLAAGYKKKYEDINKEKDTLKNDLKHRIEEAEKQIEEVSEQNQQYIIERNDMKSVIDEFKKKSEEEKKLLEEGEAELQELKKQVSQYEAEIKVLKEQKEALSEKLKDERAHNSAIEQQKVALQLALDELKKKEKASRDEAQMFGERIEVARSELRTLYQGQLEAVVKEKLKEFQNQLDAAEAALKAELLAREQQWADKANNQCVQLAEKYKSEIQQMQNLHKEELKSWRMKVIDCERLRSALECKLQEETNRRTEIAQQLHGVMESQWRQALKIITNPTSTEVKHAPVNHNEHEIRNPTKLTKSDLHINLKDFNSRASSTSSAAPNDIPFEEEGKTTYRLAGPNHDSAQLKKYIEMLLDRAPGNPIGIKDYSSLFLENTSEHLLPGNNGEKWSAFIPMDDQKLTMSNNLPDSVGPNTNKPPWK